ncbi:MAG: hypothetical protein M1828_002636 [Chrysothrix sp. TS-e1954]|nr:MAG: hypothetical protein M1828_002636 [Chrysothrix sp. TS-e1954]
MSDHQRQRLSNEDFWKETESFYTQKRGFDERFTDFLAKMPDQPEKPSSTQQGGLKDAVPKAGEDKVKASAQDHQAMPGPVKADSLPQPASKEELKKRAEELNQ